MVSFLETVMNHPARFSLPRKKRPAAVHAPIGFIACPVMMLPQVGARLDVVEAVYQQAFREAQAVVRPSVLERNLCWN